MSSLEHVINKLRNIRGMVENGISAALTINKERLEDMQRERLEKGINAEGNELERVKPRKDGKTSSYSPSYKRTRRKQGLQDRVPDLKVTGDFHDGIRAQKVGKKKITIYSNDYKNKFLTTQYDGVFGFSPDQRQQVKSLFIPIIEQTIKTELAA